MIVVYAYVCGDILHKGHIEALRNARALGDKLIVGVLTDKAIMEEKLRPTLSFDERFDMIRALSFVDCVVAQDSYNPIINLSKIQPDILAESDSHAHTTNPHFLKALGNIRMVIFPYFPDHSSSDIKNRIRDKDENQKRPKK